MDQHLLYPGMMIFSFWCCQGTNVLTHSPYLEIPRGDRFNWVTPDGTSCGSYTTDPNRMQVLPRRTENSQNTPLGKQMGMAKDCKSPYDLQVDEYRNLLLDSGDVC